MIVFYLSRNAATHTTAISSKSTELRVFRRHYNDLQDGIQSPSVLAGLLYSSNIIDADVRDIVQLPGNTVRRKNQVLLNAVEQAISSDPQCFHQLMDSLVDEAANKPLHTRIMNTYSHMCSNISSHITTHSSSCSVVTHTISQLPQQLTVRGPANHFATVQAVSDGHDRRRPQDGGDQWYTLPVSILDASSGAPVNSVVALQGDQLAPTDGVMVCYLSVTVVDKRSQGRAGTATPATHSIERNSEYAVNGRASFRMCFYVAETSYLISVGVVCVQDEEGVECIGYNVDQYTAVITTARTGKRNVCISPPQLKLKGPLTSKRFHKLMATRTNLLFRHRENETNKLVSMVSSSGDIPLDIKLYLSLEQLIDSLDIVEVEKILPKCQSLDCQNGYLLQAYSLVTLANSYSYTGDHEKALECIRDSKSLCFAAAPSYITCWIFYVEAHTLIKQHAGNITPSIRKKILELFDRTIDHSYYGTGWERYMVCCSHIDKAWFYLNGTIYYEFNPTSNYTPTEEDILLAEQHLNAVPVDEFSKLTAIKAQYHIVLGDVNRLRGETTIAIQLAEQAKQLYAEIGISLQYIDDRLQSLQSNPIDTILAEYEDQVLESCY